MKKKLFVLSAFFLLVSPVLAGEVDTVFYPPSLELTNNSKEYQGVVFASDRMEVVNEGQEPGILGKIGGLASSTLNTAQKVVETPLRFVGQFFGRNNSASTAPETAKTEVQESQAWMELDSNSVPDLSLKVKAKPFGYSESEKSEGMRLVNISTSEKKGQDSRMTKIQILLQDIVPTDEK